MSLAQQADHHQLNRLGLSDNDVLEVFNNTLTETF
jgi:hypothetical protein